MRQHLDHLRMRAVNLAGNRHYITEGPLHSLRVLPHVAFADLDIFDIKLMFPGVL